jgi:hypothetical protein
LFFPNFQFGCVTTVSEIHSNNYVVADSKIDRSNCVAADSEIDSENCVAADSELVTTVGLFGPPSFLGVYKYHVFYFDFSMV